MASAFRVDLNNGRFGRPDPFFDVSLDIAGDKIDFHSTFQLAYHLGKL